VFHFFCGSGGGAIGFADARVEHNGVEGRFENIGGIDNDPLCCQDFERLVGVPATCIDLFDTRQYTDFHGQAPPEGWREATGADVLAAAGGRYPDAVFLSPPCKGYSGLLPEKSSKTPKYQALNKLVFRSMQLCMEAFAKDPPALILIENVPRITQRGADLLGAVRQLLAMHGYETTASTHDCGEIGGLGQTRKRFLQISRLPGKLPSFVYEPVKYKLKSIGEVLNSVPPPGDTETAGAMHRLPRLQWKTWVRLALIPAGKDWRALNTEGYANMYRVVPWEEAAGTVTGQDHVSGGAQNVADPRLEHQPRQGAFRVVRWEETAPTMTASTGPGRSNSLSGIADPRIPAHDGKFPGKYQVEAWDAPSKTVCGTTDVQSGALSVQDTRMGKDRFHNQLKIQGWEDVSGCVTPRNNHVADPRQDYHGEWKRTQVSKVQSWDAPSMAVTATPNIAGSGAAIVQDPRLPYTAFMRAFRLNDWEKPSTAITSGDTYLQDVRVGTSPRGGVFGVREWDQPGATVSGNFEVHNAAAAVADPRIPEATQNGVWLIIAEDGSWHRPITTYEMAMLQGMPSHCPDGAPLVLAGSSDRVWREHIGNMVPPPAARGIAETMLRTMIPNMVKKEWYWNYEMDAVIWVKDIHGDVCHDL
jgi:site-specific DNA-cytosine methylase